MESGKQPIDPSLALINDEILSTQARLMELYVKQAQATAANEAARIQERFQAELTALQTELKQQNLALESQKALFHQTDRNLKAGLRARLLGSQRLLEAPETVLGTTDAQALRQRIAQLESTVQKAQLTTEIEAARVRETWQAELAALKAQLERTESPPPVVQTSVDEVEGTLGAEIQDLRSQLAAKVELLEHRTAELQNARTQIALLQQRIQQLELTGAQSEEAVSEGTKIRKTLQAELITLRTAFEQKDLTLQQTHTAATELEQRLNLQLRGLQSQLEEKQGLLEIRSQKIGELTTRINDLQEQIARLKLANKQTVDQNQSAAKTLQDGLCAHIQELEATIAEQAQGLKSRTADLETAQAQTNGLQQRIQQLELTCAKTEAAASEAVRIRETLQGELVALRTALEQRDSSLQQNQAAASELEERLNAQLEATQRELAEKQGLLDTRSREIGELTTKTSDLQEQITYLELANKQAVKEAKAAARALEDSLHARIQELEAAVAEKAQGLQNRTRELESAQSESAVLQQRIEQLEQTYARTEEAKNEANRTREGLQNELNNVHRALEQKDAWLAQREAEFKESSERLQTQLSDFQNQLTEKRDALETQTNELLSARSEITVLGNRIRELESAKAAVETNAITGMDRLREQFQLDLADLRTELEQRKIALEERQITIRTLEAKLNSENHRFETLVAEKQALLDCSHLQLEEKGSEITALREELARSEFARRQTEMLATTEAEQIRECVKAEVEALDAQLREKENALKSLANRGQELESKVDDLRQQLAQKELLVQSRDIEVTDLRTQADDLWAQIPHLKSAHGVALEQQRVAAGQLEQNLRVQLGELQNQLTERLALLETRNKEVQALNSKVTELADRLDRSEVALELVRATAASEIEQIHQQSQSELAARQEEIERKAEDLQDREAALYAAEQSFKDEIDALRTEVAEKRFLLENRTDQLVRVKVERDELQERIADLESARQAEKEARQKAEQEGERTRIELDKLWDELGSKRLLEERQVAVNDLNQNFQEPIASLPEPIGTLPIELSERQVLIENPTKGFLLGEPTLTETQKEKLNRLDQLLETIKADNEKRLISPNSGKWRFSLSRKRRWKS